MKPEAKNKLDRASNLQESIRKYEEHRADKSDPDPFPRFVEISKQRVENYLKEAADIEIKPDVEE